ncbi:MAG TPA: SDR family NAD(P)-dependent oxidoreductase [Candidatus Paceibacterota bacterium]
MSQRILITGGAGFIGVNTAEHFIKRGWKVLIFDNFSRVGAQDNVKWLGQHYKDKFGIVKGDVAKDFSKLQKAVAGANAIIHLAGQVAVTTSVTNPRNDFENNALGTLNVLEAIRLSKNKPTLIFASTNKVYGGLEGAKVSENKTRYYLPKFKSGVPETQPIDFHSPYGCSKGSADQYVRDYARIYGLDTVVLRQSCIYGPHQFGIEDQGWVAWFTIANVFNKKVKIYGTGKQVRDILYIGDLCRVYEMAIKNIKKVRGQILNIGGGPGNTLSLLEFMPMLEKMTATRLRVRFGEVRPGDQPVYISDISKAKRLLGWQPKINPKAGLKKLTKWVQENKKILAKYLS